MEMEIGKSRLVLRFLSVTFRQALYVITEKYDMIVEGEWSGVSVLQTVRV